MALRFTFEIDGKKQFDRTFQRTDKELSDFTDIWEEIHPALEEILTDQFQSGGAAGASGKWVPLSTKYEKIKIAKYGTAALINGPLFATERLYKSLTRHTVDSIFEANKDEMTFGTKVPYAAYHQRGGDNLPQREIFSFSDRQKRELQKRIQKKLIKNLRGAGWDANEDNFTDL